MDLIKENLEDAIQKGMIKPLSVVLFSGTEFASKLIRLISKKAEQNDNVDRRYSTWSHAGIVITKEFLPLGANLLPNEYYVWEFTCTGKLAGDRTPDIETGKCFLGVQIRKLRDVLTTYKGSVAICNLTENPTERLYLESDYAYDNRMDLLKLKLERFHTQYKNAVYQLNIWRLLASAIPSMRPVRAIFPISSHWMMCSQMIAELYKDIGVFPPRLNAENVLPQDFLYDQDGEVPSGLFVLPPIQIK